jgi:dipeptidyl aminopeptidase/acylaminoacyl peptidase
MNRVTLDGSSPRQLTTRYLGSTTAIGRDVIYFDQQEYRRNAALYSDVYVMSRESSGVRQLTSEARLLDPDLSPDGRALVCVQDRPGQRDLVLVRLKPDATEIKGPGAAPVVSGFSRTNPAIETLIAEPETQFNAPRWSPDGRTIAVERHRFGARAEVVLVDEATRAVRVVAGDARGRATTPAWRPDGRGIVVAMAHDGDVITSQALSPEILELARGPIGAPPTREIAHARYRYRSDSAAASRPPPPVAATSAAASSSVVCPGPNSSLRTNAIPAGSFSAVRGGASPSMSTISTGPRPKRRAAVLNRCNARSFCGASFRCA